MNDSQTVGYDVIVVGLGAWGAAVSYEIAKSGRRVLGIDQYSHPHPHGSSHASTRVYREADTGGSIYVLPAVESLPVLRHLEEEFEVQLFEPTGGLWLTAGEDDEHVRTVSDYREHNRPFEVLDAKEVNKRWPLLSPPEGHVAVYEEAAGALFAERLVQTLHSAARKSGADLHFSEQMLEWSEEASGVVVVTDRGRYQAEQLVLCLGPWLGESGSLDLEIVVERQVPVWFNTEDIPSAAEFPIYLTPAEPPAENIYVIPDVHNEGVKATMHRGGLRGVREELSGDSTAEDIEFVTGNLAQISPEVARRPVAKSVVCRYTNSPDLHWIVGRHPSFSNVVVVGADGGRGMKFAPFIGRAALSLIANEQRGDLEPFSPIRFQDPDLLTRTRF